jgi:hypothetical protein
MTLKFPNALPLGTYVMSDAKNFITDDLTFFEGVLTYNCSSIKISPTIPNGVQIYYVEIGSKILKTVEASKCQEFWIHDKIK